jgi:nucleosome binding factor SPN SPT16 subunit
MLTSEQGTGAVIDEWNKIKETSKFSIKDCSELINDVFTVKDQDEIENIKIASRYACFVMSALIKSFENILTAEKKVPQSSIADAVKTKCDSNKFIATEKSSNIDPSSLELVGTPIIMSGGDYNLSLNASNSDKNLTSDVIICKVNAKYKDYNANIVRTFMIDSDKTQTDHYKYLYEAYNLLISGLKEGNKLNSVYDSVIEYIKSKDETLVTKLAYKFGNGIGLDTNANLDINKENKKKISSGMAFNIILSIADLVNASSKKYSMQIADTIIVKSKDIDNLTQRIPITLNEIFYNMEDVEPEKPKKQETAGNISKYEILI